ncbi:3-oxoacyl-ACP reductase [Streptomyces fumigatiscleroticus]|nr:3-oxoacyl-ACP reductase [Streptomyces fumigatiscleroticus]
METPTALVTGAAQGLGQQFAVALAGRGYRVAGLDLVPQPRTAAKVLDYVELVGDVTDETMVRRALEQAVDRFGTLHVLINAPGTCPAGPVENTAAEDISSQDISTEDISTESTSVEDTSVEDTSVEDLRRTLRAGLEAPFLVTRLALPYLKAAGWGRIVNIASPAVCTAPPAPVPHAAARTGLIGLTRALAAALGPHGITVNAIASGPLPAVAGERPAGADGVRGRRAARRLQEPADLVSTLLYVVDAGSGFLTGQTLDLSGGPSCG